LHTHLNPAIGDATNSRRRSFGGGILRGDRLVRVAYLDEAGTSKADEEPYFVVAGVILAPDGQWNEVEAWIRGLAIDYLGEKAYPGWGHNYCFHAKDIWHGSGDFPRQEWPLKKRMEVLEKLTKIPALFNLPIVYSFSKKSELVRKLGIGSMKNNDVPKGVHANNFIRVAKSIDLWMIENTENEVIMLVAEDTDKPKKALIEGCHAMYVDRSVDRTPGAFQAERIIEQVSFIKKHQSAVLQLADICAFVIKRRLQKCEKILPLFKNLEPQIFHRARPENSLVTFAKTTDLRLVDQDEG
jgi:Protein of unknown function (DUF3800)